MLLKRPPVGSTNSPNTLRLGRRNGGTTWRFFFSFTPEPHIAFCPIFVHPLFPVFDPIFKNGTFLSVVALVSVTLVDSNPRPSSEKRSNLAPTPSSSLAQATTTELPECQERHGANTIQSVIFEKASPAEGRRRLHKNTAYALGFQKAG